MTESPGAALDRIDLIDRKLDALSSSVDARFEQVAARFDQVDARFEQIDKRFDQVSEHFVEQRQYAEFLFERLEQRMMAGFERLEKAIGVGADRIDRLERKLDQVIDSRSGATRLHRSTRKPKTR